MRNEYTLHEVKQIVPTCVKQREEEGVVFVIACMLITSIIIWHWQITKDYGLKHAEKVHRKIESGEEGEEVQGLLEQWLREEKMTKEEALMNAADMFFAGVDTVSA